MRPSLWRAWRAAGRVPASMAAVRSEEHTSELQSQSNLVCRLLLEKKKKKHKTITPIGNHSPNILLTSLSTLKHTALLPLIHDHTPVSLYISGSLTSVYRRDTLHCT